MVDVQGARRTAPVQIRATAGERGLLRWYAELRGQPVSWLLRGQGLDALLVDAGAAAASGWFVVPAAIGKAMADRSHGIAA